MTHSDHPHADQRSAESIETKPPTRSPLLVLAFSVAAFIVLAIATVSLFSIESCAPPSGDPVAPQGTPSSTANPPSTPTTPSAKPTPTPNYPPPVT